MAVISARKGRARAHPVGETARAKEWQSSQNTTDACEGSAMRTRQQFNGTLVFLENLLFSAKQKDRTCSCLFCFVLVRKVLDFLCVNAILTTIF